LLKFLVVLPASSATAERSFSTLRRLKNYLRLTRPMTQERLNHICTSCPQDKSRTVDALDINKIKQQYANEYRRSVFGQFDI